MQYKKVHGCQTAGHRTKSYEQSRSQNFWSDDFFGCPDRLGICRSLSRMFVDENILLFKNWTNSNKFDDLIDLAICT